MDDVVADAVEEVAVVSDQHQRARVAAQPLFEPIEGVDIQVVGRFVEQQHVGWHEQRTGKVGAHAPATGERTHGLIQFMLSEAQSHQQLLGPRPRAVAIVHFIVPQRLGVAHVIARGQSLFNVAFHGTQGLITVQYVVSDRAIKRLDLLSHVRDAALGRHFDVASVSVQLA